MTPIQTYVFLDLETTGKDQTNRTKITEISLVAVKRQHLLDTRIGHTPRVQHKLTLCVNPRKMIDPDATVVTGLLTKPVCLIAHNGLNFDFPILKNHLEKHGASFAEEVVCADCFHAFYDIMESPKVNKTEGSKLVDTDEDKIKSIDMGLYNNNTLDIKLKNERSPKHFINSSTVSPRNPNHVRRLEFRRFPWAEGEKPKEKYKLSYIYRRLLNRPAQNPHEAENDCLLALECAVALSEEFVNWVDENNCLFSEIKPMRIGVPLGK